MYFFEWRVGMFDPSIYSNCELKCWNCSPFPYVYTYAYPYAYRACPFARFARFPGVNHDLMMFRP